MMLTPPVWPLVSPWMVLHRLSGAANLASEDRRMKHAVVLSMPPRNCVALGALVETECDRSADCPFHSPPPVVICALCRWTASFVCERGHSIG